MVMGGWRERAKRMECRNSSKKVESIAGCVVGIL